MDKCGQIEGARTADGITTYWDCFCAPSEYVTGTSVSERTTVTFSRLCAATTGVDISRPDQAMATSMEEFDRACEWAGRQVPAVTAAGMDLVHEYRPWVEPEVTPDVEMVQSNEEVEEGDRESVAEHSLGRDACDLCGCLFRIVTPNKDAKLECLLWYLGSLTRNRRPEVQHG